LVSALTIGWGTGGYKMLIGDHFLSHTIVTMLIAWLLILTITTIIRLVFKKTE
jgi:membrane-associated PAP2 superfamily phosphatase